jgi:hypothetical protein
MSRLMMQSSSHIDLLYLNFPDQYQHPYRSQRLALATYICYCTIELIVSLLGMFHMCLTIQILSLFGAHRLGVCHLVCFVQTTRILLFNMAVIFLY